MPMARYAHHARLPMHSLQKVAIILCALIATLVLIFTIGTTARAAEPPTADQVASRVQAFYNQTRTFQARFQQDYTVKAFNKRKRSTGQVCFERPGKMSWKYDNPNGNRVVSNGATLKVYEKDNKQMFEQPINDSQYPAALAFFGQRDEENLHLTASRCKTDELRRGVCVGRHPQISHPCLPKSVDVRRRLHSASPSHAHSRRPGEPEYVHLRQPRGQYQHSIGGIQLRSPQGNHDRSSVMALGRGQRPPR